MHYFDYNASTPLLPQARAAWLAASEEFFGNPSRPAPRRRPRGKAADGVARAIRRISWAASPPRSSGPRAPPSPTTWSCTTRHTPSTREWKYGSAPSSIPACYRRRRGTFPNCTGCYRLPGAGCSTWRQCGAGCGGSGRAWWRSWRPTTRRACCSPARGPRMVPRTRDSLFLRRRAVAWQAPRAGIGRLRFRERLRPQVRRPQGCGLPQMPPSRPARVRSSSAAGRKTGGGRAPKTSRARGDW